MTNQNMKFTVSTESVKLSELLSPAQNLVAKTNKNNEQKFRVLIQNNHSTLDLYIEAGSPATVAGGIVVQPSDFVNFEDYGLDEINLISNGSNDEVRVLFC